MKKLLWLRRPIAMAACLGLGTIVSVAQSGPMKNVGQIPGSALKWIHAAIPEFERQKLNVDRYNVEVVEEDDTVTVMLLNFERPKGVRGNLGPLPEYEVTLSKKDMHLVGAHYVR
jgi:hypothetical protein